LIDRSDIPVLRQLTDIQYEVLAYLLTGAWNTVFGMGLYAIAYRFFGEQVNYIVLAIPVNVLAITNAFLCYKFFVFRTKGNWIKEYFRCCIVYGSAALANIGLLWLLVHFFSLNPVLANIFGIAVVTIISFFAHKYFSFKKGHTQKETDTHI